MDGKPSGLEAVDFVAAYAGGDGPSSAARSDGGGSGSGGDGSGPPTAGTGDAGVELGAGPPRRRMAIRLVKEARCTRAHRAGSGAPTGSGGRASCTRPPPPNGSAPPLFACARSACECARLRACACPASRSAASCGAAMAAQPAPGHTGCISCTSPQHMGMATRHWGRVSRRPGPHRGRLR